MTDESDTTSTDTDRRWWIMLRRILAALILIAIVAAFLVSHLSSTWHQCSDVVAHVGSNPVVRACQPINVADLLPPLLLVVLLLAPDIAEVSLPGLGRIRFRLEQQETKQAALETRLEAVQSTQVSQETSIAAPNYIVFDAASVQQALAGKVERFQAEVVGAEPIGRPAADLDERTASSREASETEIAVLERRLLRLWADRLEPWVAIGSRLEGSRLWRGLIRRYVEDTLSEVNEAKFGNRLRRLIPPGFGEREAELVSRWYEVFREEIEIVRGTRNAVAHPSEVGELDAQSLRRALEIGGRVADLIENEVGPAANDELPS